ncbi:biotin--acetyl-CoA-carboxylase ligase [Lactococcus lactis subsp. lactis]|nr:biotin--acetyl-CoA-carboxylase ligase [Lactococcus lactis subsp. lactis]
MSAIEKLTDKKPQIKWVNDIYLDDKKFVGILAETSLNPTQEAQVIIGVGINFSISQFPTEIEERATSLFYNEQASISRSELIAEIWSEFHRLLEGSFFEIYKSHSFILGKQVEFVQSGQTFSGRATDLTSKGELIVNLDNGQQKVLSSGEISLKKWT